MRLSAGLRQTRRPGDDRVLGALAGGCRDLPVLHPLFCRHPGFAVALHDDGPHLCRGAGRADRPRVRASVLGPIGRFAATATTGLTSLGPAESSLVVQVLVIMVLGDGLEYWL